MAAIAQIGNNLISLIDEKSAETVNSLLLVFGIHTSDVPVSPWVWSKFGKSSEKSTNCESLVFQLPFESNVYTEQKKFLINKPAQGSKNGKIV